MRRQVCLTVGGSDSCGGAGIQADLAMFARIGVAGCSAITALTAQNPERILRIEPSPPGQLAAELEAILSYYAVVAVKTGVLVGRGHIRTGAAALSPHPPPCPPVVDPLLGSPSRTPLPAPRAAGGPGPARGKMGGRGERGKKQAACPEICTGPCPLNNLDLPGRGHRANIFSSAFRLAGAACGPHPAFGTACVIDFAGGAAKKSVKP